MAELESDSQVWDVLQRIKEHVNVLEQAAARVSSSAEVYGAVQQVCFYLYLIDLSVSIYSLYVYL